MQAFPIAKYFVAIVPFYDLDGMYRDGQNGKFSIYNAHNAHYVHYAHNAYYAFWPKLRHNFTGIIISARITLCALCRTLCGGTSLVETYRDTELCIFQYLFTVKI